MFLRVWERLKKHSVTLTRPHKRSKFERYFIPLVLIISVVLMKFLLRTFVSDQTSYHLLTLIIIVSAFYGGLRSGLLATFLSAIMEATVFLPRNESIFGVYNILSTLTLVIGGVYISIISDLKHRADLQKDGFIAFASHELRNPLHKINGYVHTLIKKDAKLSKKQVVETASQIGRHAKQASTLIDELLDVTKIESGKLYFSLKKHSI